MSCMRRTGKMTDKEIERLEHLEDMLARTAVIAEHLDVDEKDNPKGMIWDDLQVIRKAIEILKDVKNTGNTANVCMSCRFFRDSKKGFYFCGADGTGHGVINKHDQACKFWRRK